jgi:hypothetical protein
MNAQAIFITILHGPCSPHYETFIGHELTDGQATIVHRFLSAKLTYPDPAAGFVLSTALGSILQNFISAENVLDKFLSSNFGQISIQK